MNIFRPSLSFLFLKHAFLSFKEGKSPMRILHNFFLKDLNIKGATLDLGSGKNASYMKFMKTEESSIKTVDFFNDSEIKIDLEKELKLERNKYDLTKRTLLLISCSNFTGANGFRDCKS